MGDLRQLPISLFSQSAGLNGDYYLSGGAVAELAVWDRLIWPQIVGTRIPVIILKTVSIHVQEEVMCIVSYTAMSASGCPSGGLSAPLTTGGHCTQISWRHQNKERLARLASLATSATSSINKAHASAEIKLWDDAFTSSASVLLNNTGVAVGPCGHPLRYANNDHRLQFVFLASLLALPTRWHDGRLVMTSRSAFVVWNEQKLEWATWRMWSYKYMVYNII